MSSSSSDMGRPHGHDTGLYDPTVHDNQIVALYETDAQARAAEQVLQSAGFAASSMQVLARDGMATGATSIGTADTRAADEGLWGSIKSLFVADEDRTTYNTAIAHGHAMLVVTPDHTMDRQHLIHVLESTDPLDFDAKLEEWRQSGYDTTGQAAGVGLSNTMTAGHASDAGANTVSQTATTGLAMAPTVHAGAAAPIAAPGDADTIKVMQEQLRVGKREVASGAVRVRSYIVERPVEESIRLHEEHVGVERHAVDRPATVADMGAFQERVIEARATSEEAVIGKEARVIEEIGVTKTANERTETVRDTVRETKVEVEGDAVGAAGTLPGSVKGNPNATPGAQTSGANSPRK